MAAVGDRASRRRKLQEAKEARELDEKKRAEEQAAIKQTGAAREKGFERLLGPLHRAMRSGGGSSTSAAGPEVSRGPGLAPDGSAVSRTRYNAILRFCANKYSWLTVL